MKSIIKQLYTILLVTVACLTVTGCSDDFKSGLRLDGDVWVVLMNCGDSFNVSSQLFR